MFRIISKTAGLVFSVLVGAMCILLSAQAETVPNSVPFDHTKTGFILRDVHTTLKCEQCHVDGVFKNTPKDCAGCHSIGSRVGATPKPINHVQTTFSCDTCHVSPTSFLVKSFQHFGIVSGCAACHGDTSNQSIGVVKINRATHIPTMLPCENCHINTSTFLSARFNHIGVVSGCAACHGGQSANVVSKPAAHIATNGLDCGACHNNTTTFLGATFGHAGVVPGTCGTCHGVQPGVKAMPALHIPTLSSGIMKCDDCHTSTNTAGYTSFLGAQYHVNAAATAPSPIGICSTCHTGAYPGVYGKSFLPTHVQTAAPCETCHANTANYTTWLGATFTHANPPGVCATCHNGVTAKGKPVYHLPTALGCDAAGCHTATNTLNYTTFLGAIFTHPSPITQRCDACHNGTTAKGKSVTHVLTTLDCVSCHTATNTANYTTFLGATFTHPASVSNTSTGVNACSYCHNGVTALGKPATHLVTTAACALCHTTALATSSWLGATGVVHTAANNGVCQTCHNGSTAKGLSAGHIPVGALSCDTGGCHSVGAAVTFAPGLMGSAQHAVVAATRCDVCHSGAYTAQGLTYGGAAAKVSNHIPTMITGSLDCNTCHKNGFVAIPGAAGWATTIGQMNHNNAQGGAPNYCVTCHLSGVSYMGAMQKKSHNGSSAAKDCSSSSCHRPLGSKGIAYSTWK